MRQEGPYPLNQKAWPDQVPPSPTNQQEQPPLATPSSTMQLGESSNGGLEGSTAASNNMGYRRGGMRQIGVKIEAKQRAVWRIKPKAKKVWVQKRSMKKKNEATQKITPEQQVKNRQSTCKALEKVGSLVTLQQSNGKIQISQGRMMIGLLSLAPKGALTQTNLSPTILKYLVLALGWKEEQPFMWKDSEKTASELKDRESSRMVCDEKEWQMVIRKSEQAWDHPIAVQESQEVLGFHIGCGSTVASDMGDKGPIIYLKEGSGLEQSKDQPGLEQGESQYGLETNEGKGDLQHPLGYPEPKYKTHEHIKVRRSPRLTAKRNYCEQNKTKGEKLQLQFAI